MIEPKVGDLPRRVADSEALAATCALRRVLVQPDAFEPEFGPAAQARVLRQFALYYPSDEEYRAISEGAALFGERWCYMSMIKRHPFRLARDAVLRYTWATALDRDGLTQLKSTDPSWHGMNPHVLYSPQGNWAVSVSQDATALLTGTREFVAAVEARLPPEEDVFGFIDQWRHEQILAGTDIRWLPDLLERVYGPGAAALIRASEDAQPR